MSATERICIQQVISSFAASLLGCCLSWPLDRVAASQSQVLTVSLFACAQKWSKSSSSSRQQQGWTAKVQMLLRNSIAGAAWRMQAPGDPRTDIAMGAPRPGLPAAQ